MPETSIERGSSYDFPMIFIRFSYGFPIQTSIVMMDFPARRRGALRVAFFAVVAVSRKALRHGAARLWATSGPRKRMNLYEITAIFRSVNIYIYICVCVCASDIYYCHVLPKIKRMSFRLKLSIYYFSIVIYIYIYVCVLSFLEQTPVRCE